jgi:hypothetical protein
MPLRQPGGGEKGMYHTAAMGASAGAGAVLTVSGVLNDTGTLVFFAALVFVAGAVRSLMPRFSRR